MKIYTRGGDSGETGLVGGIRVGKDTARIEVCGDVDELNAALGVARAERLPEPIDEIVGRVQRELFEVGAELASQDPLACGTQTIRSAHVVALEADIDALDQSLASLSGFLLPGGTRAAAMLHWARTVCRRAERRVVALERRGETKISPAILAYLNRLGDLLFTLARASNAAAGQPEVVWRPPPVRRESDEARVD
jgi:cob(I)alamin adenosyltransferase